MVWRLYKLDCKKLINEAKIVFEEMISKNNKTFAELQFQVNAIQAVLISFYDEKVENFNIDEFLKGNGESIKWIINGMVIDEKVKKYTKH